MVQFYDNRDASATTPQDASSIEEEEETSNASKEAAPKRTIRKALAVSSSSKRMATLKDISQDDDDENSEKPQEFYTGGEKSGLGVYDPREKSKVNASDLIKGILKKAEEYVYSVIVDYLCIRGGSRPDDEQDSESSASKRRFKGAGYSLGGDEKPSEKVGDPTALFRQAMERQAPKVTRTLKLWKDGFSIDDGHLYRYDDPANENYLNSINQGRAPLALLSVQYGQPVDVNVEKKTDENYVPPPKVFKAFETKGHRLGSEMSSRSPSPPTSSKPVAEQSPAAPTVEIDSTRPTTSLQIRLADGGRLVSSFNHSHTLNDIYDLVQRSRPTDRAFVLMTTFPRKELDRNDTTIEEASLLKGVVQQKFI